METSRIILLLWAALSFWGLGQIWLAQIVIYPLFAKVGAADYVGYHRFYTSRIPELIRYNWPRTASITLQAAITMLMLIHVTGSADGSAPPIKN
jgi:hypothetical protein